MGWANAHGKLAWGAERRRPPPGTATQSSAPDGPQRATVAAAPFTCRRFFVVHSQLTPRGSQVESGACGSRARACLTAQGASRDRMAPRAHPWQSAVAAHAASAHDKCSMHPCAGLRGGMETSHGRTAQVKQACPRQSSKGGRGATRRWCPLQVPRPHPLEPHQLARRCPQRRPAQATRHRRWAPRESPAPRRHIRGRVHLRRVVAFAAFTGVISTQDL